MGIGREAQEVRGDLEGLGISGIIYLVKMVESGLSKES